MDIIYVTVNLIIRKCRSFKLIQHPILRKKIYFHKIKIVDILYPIVKKL